MFNGEGQTLRTIGSEFNCDWQTQNNDWSDNPRRLAFKTNDKSAPTELIHTKCHAFQSI